MHDMNVAMQAMNNDAAEGLLLLSEERSQDDDNL